VFTTRAAGSAPLCSVGMLSALMLASALAIAPAASAAATTGVELSNDGVTFGSTLATPLFDAMPAIVPMQHVATSFVVRNGSDVPAYLSIVLSSRGWDEWNYASNLTVGAATPGGVSHAATLTTDDRCAVILEGKLLQPGESAVIETTLGLGDLTGAMGQQASAWMVLTVKLTQAISARTPRACTSGGSSVVVVPQGPTAGPSSTPSPASTATPGGAGEVPTQPPAALDAFANTGFGFDARIVLLAAFAVPAGALLFLLLGLRRRPRKDFDAPPVGALHPNSNTTTRIEMDNTL
jgi:hypothetical protein